MCILENLPLVGRVFEFLFALVRQPAGFEINRVSKVFLFLQYAGNGIGNPTIRVIGRFGGGIATQLHPMNCRTLHLCFFQLVCNLRGTIALHAPSEDLTDNGCGFIINNPMLLRIVGVFHVAIGRIGGQILTGFAFLLHGCLNLFTAVLDVKFVDDIQERSKIVVLLIGAVHTAVYGNETDIVFGEKHLGIDAYLQIVSADTAHVFGEDDTNFIILHQFDHMLPIGSVEVRPGVPVIHEILDISETLVFSIPIENRLLIDNAVAIACKFIVTT